MIYACRRRSHCVDDGEDIPPQQEPPPIPTVEYDDPPELGRILGPDGQPLLIVHARRPVGYIWEGQ